MKTCYRKVYPIWQAFKDVNTVFFFFWSRFNKKNLGKVHSVGPRKHRYGQETYQRSSREKEGRKGGREGGGREGGKEEGRKEVRKKKKWPRRRPRNMHQSTHFLLSRNPLWNNTWSKLGKAGRAYNFCNNRSWQLLTCRRAFPGLSFDVSETALCSAALIPTVRRQTSWADRRQSHNANKPLLRHRPPLLRLGLAPLGGEPRPAWVKLSDPQPAAEKPRKASQPDNSAKST